MGVGIYVPHLFVPIWWQKTDGLFFFLDHWLPCITINLIFRPVLSMAGQQRLVQAICTMVFYCWNEWQGVTLQSLSTIIFRMIKIWNHVILISLLPFCRRCSPQSLSDRSIEKVSSSSCFIYIRLQGEKNSESIFPISAETLFIDSLAAISHIQASLSAHGEIPGKDFFWKINCLIFRLERCKIEPVYYQIHFHIFWGTALC